MAITDIPELVGLRGTRSDAATTCLVRYFQVLKRVKPRLRALFDEEDRVELATAIRDRYRTAAIPSDALAVVSAIANDVSEVCAEKLRGLKDVERIAFLDAVERTATVDRRVGKLAGVQRPLML